MPRSREYAPLPASPADDDASSTAAGPSPRSNLTLSPTALHVDELFQRWTRTIKERIRVKHRKRAPPPPAAPIEILASVFEVWQPNEERVGSRSSKGKGKEVEEDAFRTLDHEEPMNRDAFDGLVGHVQEAINHGMQPKLNSKGSSGSYFAKDIHGNTLGIFKPKDEEPYGNLNPKFTKWLHRNFLSRIIPFGRACLIPQLSYLSEAAASLIDRRLDAHIVPRTEVVEMSSPAFFYDWIDRERAAKGRKGRNGSASGLRAKPGSFQVFLKGFQDASDFLKTNPYPGRPLAQTLDPSPRRRKRIDLLYPFRCLCGRSEAEEDDDDESGWGWGGEDEQETSRKGRRPEPFKWTEELMASFREALDPLIIMDYLIRNTDRGLDNFMVKACNCTSPPSLSSPSPMSEVKAPSPIASPSIAPTPPSKAHMHIAAIDNSLAFPHMHPHGWRTYPYGWLYLPISLVGVPFSAKTREHYLPLLSSPTWWATTTMELRELFQVDPDFSEEMFRRQMAVLKGQAFNIVQSLRDPEDGPIDLCRRQKKLVWDDRTTVADDDFTRSLITAAGASPHPTPAAPPPSPPLPPLPSPPLPPLPSPSSSPTSASKRPSTPPPSFPVPLKRVSSDRPSPGRLSLHARSLSSGVPKRVFGELTGVGMLEHLERVEKAGRARGAREGSAGGAEYLVVNSDDDEEDEGEEEDGGDGDEWGVKSEGDLRGSARVWPGRWSADIERGGSAARGGGRSRSGSLGNVEPRREGRGKGRGRPSWLGEVGEEAGEEDAGTGSGSGRTKVVIVERLESVEDKSWFSSLLSSDIP